MEIKIEDLMKLSELRCDVLQLIYSTDLSETLIEEILLPIERTLSDNGVNLKEKDV